MANLSNASADLRRHLAVEAPPHPIPKDMQGPDNPIPLSPQWLLPKPADNKLGILSGYSFVEPHSSSHHGNGEDSESGKRKDIFRPSLYDLESGRRDRWHDEERETHTATRRDRWREAEKELGDVHRTERWSDNSVKHSGEARRAPSERRTDSANRDNNYDQRRESKWNTRWGPDNKESENRRDKWSDSRDKGTSQLIVHGRDVTSQGKDTDRDGEHSRSWRSNSFLARGRGETDLPPPLTPNKQTPVFGYGRGRGENVAPIFSAGRGGVNNAASRSYPIGFTPEKSDGSHGDPFDLRYSRMKFLDIYRMTDLKSLRILLEGFVDVPSLTIAEPLEPLALSAPTSEEMVTLKGMDKGDIVSSGLPQVSKEGSTGKNFVDPAASKQPRSGSREDTGAHGDYLDESSDNIKGDHSSYLDTPAYAKYSHPHALDSKGPPGLSYQTNKLTAEAVRSGGMNGDEVGTREVSMTEKSSSHHTMPWRSQSAGERSQGSPLNWQDSSTETRTRTSYFRDESQWQNNDLHAEQKNNFKIKRQSSEVLDQERDATLFHSQDDPFISRDKAIGKFPPTPSPEDLSLYYKDPQGRIQGPFAGIDLIGWFEAGYFGIDLQVRIATAPADAPFSLLGDVMPHLRAKARPPPGFGAVRQNDVAEAPSRGNFGLGSAHSAVGEFEAVKDMQRNRHGAATEAENRFIESLMSGNINSSSDHYSFAEGMKAYSTRAESMSDMNYLLAQRMSLERQRSLPTALPSPQSNFLPHVGEASRQIPQSPKQVDFLSMLQAAGDKSSSPAVNSTPVWPNISEVPSLNNLVHTKIDMHHNQHITSQTGFGAQHQMLHPQAQPLPHLLAQTAGLSSAATPPEKLLASEISQDPQILSLLQQQYLMSQIQLQSQSSLPSQLSLLDKYLLLKQQQQQQEQQLLLQQQHLLSQVLTGHQPHQHFGDLSLGHLEASVPAGNASGDRLGMLQMHEALHMPVLSSLDGHSSNHSNFTVQGPKDVNSTASSGPSPPHLPHQMFDQTSQSNEWVSNLPKEVKSIPNSGPEATRATTESSLLAGPMDKSVEDIFAEQKNVLDLDNNAMRARSPAVGRTKENMTSVEAEPLHGTTVSGSAGASDVVSSLSEKINDAKISPESTPEQFLNDVPSAKEVKVAEVKEAKKASERKSRKQKNGKAQLVSELGKGSSKPVSAQQIKPDFQTEGMSSHLEDGFKNSVGVTAESLDSEHTGRSSSTKMTNNEAGFQGNAEWVEVGMPSNSSQTTNHRAWKPAPGLKPKSLLEIQQEEACRVQTETVLSETSVMAAPTNSSRTHWAGIVANSDHQSGVDIVQNPSIAQVALGSSANSSITSRSRISQLHDLLAEEVLAKSNEENNNIPNEKDSTLPPLLEAQAETRSADDDFVEAKDTKKSRKKAAKAAKAAGLKASPPVTSAYLSAPLVSVEKSRSTRQTQQEKEQLPGPSAGPSLGDFVLWKGDQSNTAAAPAWSTESKKLHKPTSLKDILKEQEQKNPPVQQQIPIPTPPKAQSSRGNRGSGASWTVPGSSPSKVASPSQTIAASPGRTTSVTSNQPKSKTEDDLFWGPLDQSKQETKLSEFPSLGKGSSGKGASGVSSTRQKQTTGFPSPAIGQPSSKGKKSAASKHSEATDFRDWCECELVKLTGSNDTSFLEFCLKQTTAEAEMLLRENLGSVDRNHVFIDKFLNYKDFLAPDVIEMAFNGDTIPRKETKTLKDSEAEAGGVKKKGKKGKKVSPSVLGFSVVSNRIMMGEIQTIED